jgi:mercuric ion transport protein
MTNDKTLKIGIVGSVIAALCCFTPVLVILFGAIGLSAIVGILDFVLIPALLIFILITVYALWKRQNKVANKRSSQIL